MAAPTGPEQARGEPLDGAMRSSIESGSDRITVRLRHSRVRDRKMIQNLWRAAGYNIVAIPLAARVLAPWGIVLHRAVGAVLMSLSTLVVAINAQLVRGVRL